MGVEWMRVVADVGVGGAVGTIDQLVQNEDDKRKLAKPDLGLMGQYGTYFNYGVPIVAIGLAAFGVLKDHWATRAITAGAQLAGRKVTLQVTKKAAVPWTGWKRNAALEAQRRAEAAAKQAGGGLTPAGVGLEF